MECECYNGDHDQETNILSCHLKNVLKDKKGASDLRLGFSVLGHVRGQLCANLIQLDKVFSGYYDNIGAKETKETTWEPAVQ